MSDLVDIIAAKKSDPATLTIPENSASSRFQSLPSLEPGLNYFIAVAALKICCPRLWMSASTSFHSCRASPTGLTTGLNRGGGAAAAASDA